MFSKLSVILFFMFCGQALASTLHDGISVNKISSDEFSLRVTTPFPDLKAIRSNDKQSTLVTLENFDSRTEPGMPAVPHKVIHVVVPPNKKILLGTTIHKHTVKFGLASEIDSTKNDIHNPDEFTPRNPRGQSSLGKNLAVVEDVSFAGHDRLATITVWPISYNSATRTLGHTSDFEIKVAFKDDVDSPTTPPVSRTTSNLLQPLVVNPWNLSTEPSSKIDLIIAHETYRDSIMPYVEFKKSKGREVRLKLVSTLTATKIKETIQTEYRQNPPPSSTMLIGNIDQIPSWRGSGDNTWTDFPYQNLDNGDVPDISLGRVPAHNSDELTAFLTKAMARENNPPAAGEILLTAGRDVSLGCPDNVSKVGEHIKSGEDGINLVKKFRSKGVSTEEIISAYNSSPNIIVYDGHGDHTGMVEIPLVLSNLSKLTNTAFPIIFDIACLNANWSRGASRRNFTEMVLLKKDHGAAGIMASGGSGYGHDFFQTIGKLSAVARKETNQNQVSILNEVGSLIWAAKIKHGSQDRSYWNYYGDPSTHIWPE